VTALLSRQLGTFSLAALLVGANYGLGFILGTAEKALTQGAAGSLYAVSTGLGLFVLAGFARFYWTEQEPIWTLLGRRYGSSIKSVVGLMSWAWMLGVVAAQILGGAFILKCLGLPLPASLISMAILFSILSLLSVEKVGKIFKLLLTINSIVILYALVRLDGLSDYFHAPIDFFFDLKTISIPQQLGTVLTTVLLIPIGMQFQVFLVQSQNVTKASRACILGGIVLILLAFVPSEVAIAARNSGILPVEIVGKEVIPYVLSWLGGGLHQPLSIFLMLFLLCSALGSGSGLLRAMNHTLFELDFFPSSDRLRFLFTFANVMLALAIASMGGSIIGLMVSFYALYVSSVWIPFLAYLLDRNGQLEVSRTSLRLALAGGSFSSITALITTFVLPTSTLWDSQQLSILVVGFSGSALGFLLGYILEKYAMRSSLTINSDPF
jgi:solute:Na+ symporter, SSS family